MRTRTSTSTSYYNTTKGLLGFCFRLTRVTLYIISVITFSRLFLSIGLWMSARIAGILMMATGWSLSVYGSTNQWPYTKEFQQVAQQAIYWGGNLETLRDNNKESSKLINVGDTNFGMPSVMPETLDVNDFAPNEFSPGLPSASPGSKSDREVAHPATNYSPRKSADSRHNQDLITGKAPLGPKPINNGVKSKLQGGKPSSMSTEDQKLLTEVGLLN